MGDPHGVRSEQEGVEDGVGQVKEGLGGGRTRVDIKAREWRPLGVGGISRFGPQNRGRGPVRPGDRRTRGVIVEAALGPSKVAGSPQLSDERWKEMDKIAPAWV